MNGSYVVFRVNILPALCSHPRKRKAIDTKFFNTKPTIVLFVYWKHFCRSFCEDIIVCKREVNLFFYYTLTVSDVCLFSHDICFILCEECAWMRQCFSTFSFSPLISMAKWTCCMKFMLKERPSAQLKPAWTSPMVKYLTEHFLLGILHAAIVLLSL